MKKTFAIIFSGVLMAWTTLAGAQDNPTHKKSYFNNKTNELKSETSELKTEWQANKEAYKNKFIKTRNKVEGYIKELDGALDYGDAALRKTINEDIADFKRVDDDFKKIEAEIIASTAVKWYNIKDNLRKAKENVTEKTI